MKTRSHIHEEVFDQAPEVVFRLLHTPSAIRHWWGAARAIVMPESGGIWAAAWGNEEDDPDYITVATIRHFDPPHRMVLEDYRYRTRDGELPFEASFTTTFLVHAGSSGTTLRVEQAGFPATDAGNAFLAACEQGWRDTFAGIRAYL